MSPFFDVQECAAYLRLEPGTIYKKVSKGEIPFRKHGSRLVFPREEIEQWSREGSKPKAAPAPSRFQLARERVRSLTTEHTTHSRPIQQGVG